MGSLFKMTQVVFVALLIYPLDDYKDRYGSGWEFTTKVFKDEASAFQYLKKCVYKEVENYYMDQGRVIQHCDDHEPELPVPKRKKGAPKFRECSFDDPRNLKAYEKWKSCVSEGDLNAFCRDYYGGEYVSSQLMVRIDENVISQYVDPLPEHQ